MAKLIPVAGNPFDDKPTQVPSAGRLVPVDGNPFEEERPSKLSVVLDATAKVAAPVLNPLGALAGVIAKDPKRALAGMGAASRAAGHGALQGSINLGVDIPAGTVEMLSDAPTPLGTLAGFARPATRWLSDQAQRAKSAITEAVLSPEQREELTRPIVARDEDGEINWDVTQWNTPSSTQMLSTGAQSLVLTLPMVAGGTPVVNMLTKMGMSPTRAQFIAYGMANAATNATIQQQDTQREERATNAQTMVPGFDPTDAAGRALAPTLDLGLGQEQRQLDLPPKARELANRMANEGGQTLGMPPAARGLANEAADDLARKTAALTGALSFLTGGAGARMMNVGEARTIGEAVIRGALADLPFEMTEEVQQSITADILARRPVEWAEAADAAILAAAAAATQGGALGAAEFAAGRGGQDPFGQVRANDDRTAPPFRTPSIPVQNLEVAPRAGLRLLPDSAGNLTIGNTGPAQPRAETARTVGAPPPPPAAPVPPPVAVQSEAVPPPVATPPQAPPEEPMLAADRPAFTMPRSMAKAAPRFRDQLVNFESDLDRAAYILANDTKRGESRSAGDLRKSLEAAGIPVEVAAEHGQRVLAAVKAAAQTGGVEVEVPAVPFSGPQTAPAPASPAAAVPAARPESAPAPAAAAAPAQPFVTPDDVDPFEGPSAPPPPRAPRAGMPAKTKAPPEQVQKHIINRYRTSKTWPDAGLVAGAFGITKKEAAAAIKRAAAAVKAESDLLAPPKAAPKAEPKAKAPPATAVPDMDAAPEPGVDSGILVMQNRQRDRPVSVAQMRSIAKNPDPDRLSVSRSPDTGAPMVSSPKDSAQIPESDMGREERITFSDGRKMTARYAVVEADSVLASSTVDGNPVADYFAPPRAGQLYALNNGRTAGLRAAWESGTADGYREGIIADAPLHGVDPEAIRAKKNPILVRVYPDAENVGDIAAESNKSNALGLSPTEQAESDARALPPLEQLVVDETGDLKGKENLGFFRSWFKNLGLNDTGTLIGEDGLPNVAAATRLTNAIFARAYRNRRLTNAVAESTNPDVKNVLTALTMAAPSFAKLDPEARLGGIIERVTEAVEILRRARRDKLKVGQQDDALYTPDPTALQLALEFERNIRAPRRLGEQLTNLAEFVAEQQRGDTSLDIFGARPEVSYDDALKAIGAYTESGNDQADAPRAVQPGDAQGDAGRAASEVQREDQVERRAEAPADAAGQAGSGVRLPREQDQGEGIAPLTLAPQEAPAPAPAQPPPGGDLFAAPTPQERVRAAQEQRDAERNGRTGGRESGDGGLFDGPRPEQVQAVEGDALTRPGPVAKGEAAAQQQPKAEPESPEARLERIRATPISQRDPADVEWANAYTRQRAAQSKAAEEKPALPDDVAEFARALGAGMAAGVAAKTLLGQTGTSSGRVVARHDLVRDAVAAGARVGTKEGQPALVLANGNHILQRDLTGTAINFARWLIAKRDGALEPKTEPTEAQREAGNYAKGHLSLHGLDIAIENPAGTRRRPEWPPLAHHYGYIKRTEAADGDHVDVFLGPRAEDPELPVFVVDQVDKNGRFDEHKVVLGAATKAEAQDIYRANYEKGWDRDREIVEMTMDQFKDWLANGDTTKAAAKAAQRKIEDVGEKIGGARKDLAPPTGSARKKSDDPRPAWARRFEISQVVTPGGMIGAIKDAGKWIIRDTKSTGFAGQFRQVGSAFDSKEEAEAFVPIAAVGLKHRPVPASRKEGGPTKYEIWREISDRKRVKVVDQEFDTRDDAMRYMAENAIAILETNTTFGEADIPLPPNRERRGPAKRTGNVTGEDFKEVFGFRGVEFGEWNNQDERQALLNDAWDGLMDLADVLGIPPRAISLGGDLALAFGARGHGLQSARAHYETDRAVINLTKERGAGSLAHEWFHALDHYFGRQDGKASAKWEVQPDGTRILQVGGADRAFASSGFSGNRSGVRPEVRAAYEAILKTMATKAQTYVQDMAQVDKFTGAAREDLARELDALRRDLSEQKDRAYWKRNHAPASAEQLAEFDRIAKAMLDGDVLAITVDWRTIENKSKRLGADGRWTNDSLEQLSAIYKAVRGRSGFDGANQRGVLDKLRGSMTRYSQRLKMLADAQTGTDKTKNVPTDFAMNARELDQGRGSDYWTSPHEMAARAFQGYVEDKIAERGGVSRFLNYGPENVGILTPWGFKRPFPAGTERQAINAAFDQFFKTIETRTDDAGNVGFFSLPSTPAAPGKRPAPAAIKGMAARAASTFGVTINVVPNTSHPSVPERVRGTNPTANGYTDGFQAWVFTDNIVSLPHAAAVIAHEVVGHVGVEAITGEEEWKAIEATVTGVLSGRIAADDAQAAEANRRGAFERTRELPKAVTLEVARIIREARARYPQASDRLLAKEAVAIMAERGVKSSMLDRMLAALRRALRKVFKGIAFTDAELRDLLARSNEALRAGARRGVQIKSATGNRGTFDPKNPNILYQSGGEIDEVTGLPLNPDGTVTVYHHTNAAAAELIRRTGRLTSAGEPDVYVTTRRETDTGYGDVAVPVRVSPDLLQIDDEFPNGRRDFRIDTGRPGGSVAVKVGELAEQSEGVARSAAGGQVPEQSGVVRVIYRGTNDSGERISGGIAEGTLFAAADEATAKNYAGTGGKIERIGVKQDAKVLVEGSKEFAQVTGRRRGKLIDTLRKGENLKTAADDAAAKARAAGYDALEFTSLKDLGIAIFNEDKFVRDYSPAQQLNQSPAFDGPEVGNTPIGDATEIEVDGKQRPTRNSAGQPIHPTEEGIRNFWRWFGDSKAVDEQGRPLVVYHGTGAAFDTFDASYTDISPRGDSAGAGFFFTADPIEASGYAQRPGGNVMPAYLRVTRPHRIDHDSRHSDPVFLAMHNSRADAKAMRAKLLADGYDGILTHLGEWVAFRPDQIKSATGNVGAFGQRPVTAAEAAPLGLTAEEANEAQARGDIRFAQGTPDLDDPATARTALERIGAAVKERPALTLDAVKGMLTGVSDATRAMRYKLLPRFWQVEFGKGTVPSVATYAKIADRMVAEANEQGQKADRIANAWANLYSRIETVDAAGKPSKELTVGGVTIPLAKARTSTRAAQADLMADIMARATVAGFDPDRTANSRLNELDQVIPAKTAAEIALERDFQRLDPDVQQLYRDVREHYVAERLRYFQTLRDMITASTPDLPSRRALIAKLKAEFEGNAVKAPYFPLARFGDYWIAAVGKTDGTTVKKVDLPFAMADSPFEQQRIADAMRRDGWIVETGKKLDEGARQFGASSSFVQEVAAIIDRQFGPKGEPGDAEGMRFTSGADDSTATALKDAIYQLHLTTLPELSMRKQFVHRTKRAGWSRDALRAFAQRSSRSARQTAKLRYGWQLSDTLKQMREEAQRAGDKLLAADVVNASQQNFEWTMNPQREQWSVLATQFGFLWYLGLTPAAAFINLSQQVQFTLPRLATEYGGGIGGDAKVIGAMLKANSDYVAALLNRSKRAELEAEMDGDVGRMLTELEESGKIDRTQTLDLSGIAESDAAMSLAQRRVVTVMGFMFHHMERMNREATALAAYRLERARGGSHEAAVEAASYSVDRTQFNYESTNRAQFMQGSWMPVLTLFKQYALNVSLVMYRDLQLILGGDRATKQQRRRARKELTYILGMTSLMAGAVGLPLFKITMGAATMVAALFGGDDDEPFDAELEFRAMLADWFGEKGGELVAKGPVNALGIELSSRVSLGELWWRAADRELEGDAAKMHAVEQIIGPVFSLPFRFADAFGMAADGNMDRAAEAMMPKFIRDYARMARYAREGMRSMSGEQIIDEFTAIELTAQAIGFSPSRVGEAYDELNAIKRIESRTVARRQRILTEIWRGAQAVRRGEPDAAERIAEARAMVNAWNRANPDWPITGDNIRVSLRSRATASRKAVTGAQVSPHVMRRLEDRRFATDATAPRGGQ